GGPDLVEVELDCAICLVDQPHALIIAVVGRQHVEPAGHHRLDVHRPNAVLAGVANEVEVCVSDVRCAVNYVDPAHAIGGVRSCVDQVRVVGDPGTIDRRGDARRLDGVAGCV